MAKQDDGRKLTTEDVIHIGMATKDPGAYMFASLVIEILKLPFVLLAAVFGSIKASKVERQSREEARKKAELAAIAVAESRARSEKEYEERMEKRKQEFIRAEKERQDRALVESLRVRSPDPEIRAEFGPAVKEILKTPTDPDCYVDSYLYALELVQVPEIQGVLLESGLSPAALEEKLRQLHEQNRQPAGTSGHRITPRIKKALALAGRVAKARFSRENPGQSGSVEVTVRDLFEGALDTEDFAKELAPVWDHLRAARKTA